MRPCGSGRAPEGRPQELGAVTGGRPGARSSRGLWGRALIPAQSHGSTATCRGVRASQPGWDRGAWPRNGTCSAEGPRVWEREQRPGHGAAARGARAQPGATGRPMKGDLSLVLDPSDPCIGSTGSFTLDLPVLSTGSTGSTVQDPPDH